MAYKHCFFFMILAGCLFSTTPFCHAGKEGLPFSRGEQLQYVVKWEMIRAGQATFKVLDTKPGEKETGYRFVLEARSDPYVDIFYKVRDRLEASTDRAFARSMLYRKTQSGKADKKVVVEFDWKKKTATYSNFGQKRDPIKIPAETFDPLSSFYKMRTLEFAVDQSRSFSVTDGKKWFVQDGKVINRESITIDSGTYDTYVIIPTITHLSGIFQKSKDPTIKIWITADEKKIPVRVKIKVFIGSILFDLVSVN